MFQCPTCHEDNLFITHSVTHITDVNSRGEAQDSDAEDLTWEDTSQAGCCDCGWSGTVAGMTVNDEQETNP